MIVLTIKFIAEGKGSSDVSPAKPKGLSIAFGNIVYAFMCHHSIPSIISPMKVFFLL
jgi:amino acid permease